MDEVKFCGAGLAICTGWSASKLQALGVSVEGRGRGLGEGGDSGDGEVSRKDGSGKVNKGKETV